MRKNDWIDSFLTESQKLGKAPTTGDMLSFFSKFSMHRLDKAILGMSVNLIIFMNEDAPAEAYCQEFHQYRYRENEIIKLSN